MFNIKNIEENKIEDFVNIDFQCDCGIGHNLTTEKIVVKKDCIPDLVKSVDDFLPFGRVLIVSCEDVFENITRHIVKALKSGDRDVLSFQYQKKFVPTIKMVSKLFGEPNDIRLVIAVGGGAILDVAKYFASIRGLKLFAFSTSPSNDSALTPYSEFYVDGICQALKSKSPDQLFCDLSIIAKAPRHMLASGYGKIVSSYLILFDWHISNKFTNEVYCDKIGGLIENAIQLGVSAGEKLLIKDSDGYNDIVEAQLKLSIAKALVGIPTILTSGCRNASNVLVMLQKNKNEKILLNGEYQFQMFIKIISIYKLFFEQKTSDNGLPPDFDARYELIRNELNLSEEIASAMTSRTISSNAYEFMKKMLEQERDYFLTSISTLEEMKDSFIDVFKLLYNNKKENWWYKVNINDLKTAIVLSTEVEPRFNTLSIMKHLGLLEGYLY